MWWRELWGGVTRGVIVGGFAGRGSGVTWGSGACIDPLMDVSAGLGVVAGSGLASTRSTSFLISAIPEDMGFSSLGET